MVRHRLCLLIVIALARNVVGLRKSPDAAPRLRLLADVTAIAMTPQVSSSQETNPPLTTNENSVQTSDTSPPQQQQTDPPAEMPPTKTDSPEETKTNAPPLSDPCLSAGSCQDCFAVAFTTKATIPGSTCYWSDGSCKLVSKGNAPSSTEDMCLPKPSDTDPRPGTDAGGDMSGDSSDGTDPPKDANLPVTGGSSSQTEFDFDDEDEENSLAFALGVGLLALVLVGTAAIRFRVLKGSSALTGDGGDAKSALSDFTSILGGTSTISGTASYGKGETVPLATAEADDDEWGWEDSTSPSTSGDVELTTTKNEDEDLTMAFAVSRQLPKSSPVMTRATLSATSSTATAKVAMPALQIQSLSKPTVPPKKKSVVKREDDLFASMGLAAKPTFNKTVKPAKASALAASDVGGDATWDEDGDLDDLLND